MGGIFNLIKNLGRAGDAKAQKAADEIDSKNSVEFAKQDIGRMKKDLATCNENIGTIKGELAILKDKIKGIKLEIKKHDEDAKALADTNEALAVKHCEASESMESQLEPLEIARKTQEDLLADQIKTKEELKSAVQQAEADMVTLKAMNDAANANEKLAKINVGSSTSALSEFQRRKEEAKKRLIRAQAIKEESSGGDSLQEETNAALGLSGGASRLARLKAK